MKLVIQGKNIEITDAINEYVHQKIEKAVSHFQNITTEVDVHLSVARNPRISAEKHVAEVTLYANGTVIRSEERGEDLYASIDLVGDKIARQLRKYKEKRLDKNQVVVKTGGVVLETPVEVDLIGDRTPELPTEVLRMKYFAMPPMSIDQALEQLQLVDHDFYVFCNSKTNEINVIYERNHGGYGVIQPRHANGQSKNGKVATTTHT